MGEAGRPWAQQSKIRWDGSMLLTPQISNKNPLVVSFVQNVKIFSNFPQHLSNLLHHIAFKDPLILKNFPRGKGHPLFWLSEITFSTPLGPRWEQLSTPDKLYLLVIFHVHFLLSTRDPKQINEIKINTLIILDYIETWKSFICWLWGCSTHVP